MQRILITEDDKFIANICRGKFEQEGFEVIVAHDGRAAIESLKSTIPDAVLLDLMLPEINGIAVLQYIRGQESLRKIPVIVLSNLSYFSGLAQSAWQAGATNFLNKGDHGPNSLVGEVRKLLAIPTSGFSDRTDAPPGPAEVASDPARGPIRVLIADDDKLIHGVLGFFMEQAGFEVRSAYDGRRALEIAIAEQPDILLLDGMMPQMDGFAVLQAWRNHPQLAKIPVVMLSGEKDLVNRADALGGGAVEYLSKPFSPDAVVALVRQYAG
jgi:DNA-binding response OmpR family regulator